MSGRTIAAYLDGELDASAVALFEQHLLECRVCNAELNAQRLFMCELDSTLTLAPDLPVPSNFAQIVAARAESDMSGVRDGRRTQAGFAVLSDSRARVICSAWARLRARQCFSVGEQ